MDCAPCLGCYHWAVKRNIHKKQLLVASANKKPFKIFSYNPVIAQWFTKTSKHTNWNKHKLMTTYPIEFTASCVQGQNLKVTVIKYTLHDEKYMQGPVSQNPHVSEVHNHMIPKTLWFSKENLKSFLLVFYAIQTTGIWNPKIWAKSRHKASCLNCAFIAVLLLIYRSGF